MIAMQREADPSLHDRERDRRRQTRDHMLLALKIAGQALTPAELAHRAGLGALAVRLAATRFPAYFVVTYDYVDTDHRHIARIDLHPHLRRGA